MNKKTRILVAENDPPVAALMTYLLTCAGHEVETAFNGKSAMELATTRKFALIVLAAGLPGIGGFEMCRELKQRHISHRTPIILLSRNDAEERRARAYESEAADFIGKPFKAEDFLDRVALHIQHQPGPSDVFDQRADTNTQRFGNTAQGDQ